MAKSKTRVSRMLLYKADAGGMSDQVLAQLAKAFPDHVMRDLGDDGDFTAELTAKATVVVAGGDGSIRRAAQALARSKRRMGVLPLGTYNNFAASLGIPARLEKAIAVVKRGNIRKVTLGRVDGAPFIELAAIGMFGEAIALGEKAKHLEFGKLGEHLGAVAGPTAFEYRISGDIEGHGQARSLVFVNTPSTGIKMPVGDTRPEDPYLELAVKVGESRGDIVGRVLASIVLDKHAENGGGMSFHFRSVKVRTKPAINVYADKKHLGRTPVKIEADPGALRVIVP